MWPIAVIGAEGETVETPTAAAAPAEPAAPAANLATGPAQVTPASPGAAETGPARSGRVAISPRARRLAGQKGVDFSGIAGSGPSGRIMVKDIESALDASPIGWEIICEVVSPAQTERVD